MYQDPEVTLHQKFVEAVEAGFIGFYRQKSLLENIETYKQ